MTPPSAAVSVDFATSAPPDPLLPLPGAVGLFRRLCGAGSFSALPKPSGAYDSGWTAVITTMAMILGHLVGHGTLETVVGLARTGLLDELCLKNLKFSTRLATCSSTSAYSQARARLSLPWLRRCLGLQTQQLQTLAGGWQWHELAVRVLDGTMITMRPHGRIPERFPAHSNQHGSCYWCQMRTLACMCLGTGVVLALVIGSKADSEQAQTVRLILCGCASLPSALPASVLWMGDANFGVWRVVAAASQCGQHSLMRMTPARAKKLAGATPLKPGLDLSVSWSPSKYDQIDRSLRSAAVVGRLVIVRVERCGYRPEVLLLFTTLAVEISPAELATLYLKRWKIELSLRHFKTQMGLGELVAKSPAMARRELFTGVLAYNLVRGAMLLAAAKGGESLAAMSFAKARVELGCMFMVTALLLSDSNPSWEAMLVRIVSGKLRPRRKPRPPEPRLKRHRRETFPPLKGARAAARNPAPLPYELAPAKS